VFFVFFLGLSDDFPRSRFRMAGLKAQLPDVKLCDLFIPSIMPSDKNGKIIVKSVQLPFQIANR